MSEYEAIIGLEVHAQLKTNSKLFCACSTRFGQEPNTNVCPVCTGMPGALPVMNQKALEYAAKLGLALNCQLNRNSVFARKNYFYPDLPKGYQISQYEHPLAEHGSLEIMLQGQKKSVGIVRIHMEDDAGKSIHSPADNKSYVDLNRTGVPLIEIVSGPDIHSAEEAVAYLKNLRSILRYLGICDGNMEEGNFRCDANVSVKPKHREEFGTRTELKNLNSFRYVQKALEFEINRQQDLLEDGEEVVQETRLYDENKGKTRSMRGKEEAHDYRYFPDPDLVQLQLGEEEISDWKQHIPELPLDRMQRFISSYSLPEQDAVVLTGEKDLADYFENTVSLYNDPKTVSNWIMSEMLREMRELNIEASESPFGPGQLASLLGLVHEEKISSKIGKEIFPEVFREGMDPEAYVQEKGLLQISDQNRLQDIVEQVLEENPDEVQSYKSGKKKLLSYFMGQVMKKTKGQANPQVVDDLLKQKLQ
ncbi:MAG: Asp-tRNA(Asn)/Glu-tRNA(Gln) amidotransferase subunit GatB [Thermodesulfobacteriota bacterium]